MQPLKIMAVLLWQRNQAHWIGHGGVRILLAMVFLRPVGLPTTLEETKSRTSPAVSPGLLSPTFMTIHISQFRFADVVDVKTSGGNCPSHDSSRNRCWRSLTHWM